MSTEQNNERTGEIADALGQHRERLRHIAAMRANPLLLKRLTIDDVLQEVYLAACRRVGHWQKASDIPPFIRLRTLLLQTITDLHRKHLGAQKRDAHREVELGGDAAEDFGRWLADSITSPRTKLANAERAQLVRQVVGTLSENDREVLTLRHFEELTNQEVASVLGIEPKAASIRYFRALKRLQVALAQVSEFQP